MKKIEVGLDLINDKTGYTIDITKYDKIKIDMKKLKTFEQYSHINESLIDGFCDKLNIKLQEVDNQLEVICNKNHVEIISMDVEPEVGSYTHRMSMSVDFDEKDGQIEIIMELISGEYGCEEDEDDSFEPEFDYQVGYSTLRQRRLFKTQEDVIGYIIDTISDYK